MEERFTPNVEKILKEERIQNLMKLRKIKLNQKLFQARQRKFDINFFNKQNAQNEQKIKERQNEEKKKIILKFNEEDYFIEPEDLNLNESLNDMKFIETNDIINNITELLNNIDDINSIMFGILMMRKFTVIEAVLINKSHLFIKNELYRQILNVLNTYYNNQKVTFECLWILSSLVYDSKDKNMYHFLLNDKCIELYKKIASFYCSEKYDMNIIKVMTIFILNILIFKQKEAENEKNIINFDTNDDVLLDFLSGLVDLIINLEINEEIYISLLIEITNCFNLQTLLKNDLLNKIIIFLINETIINLDNREYYYEEEINEYYEKYCLNSKMRINTIYQIILIQLQYFMSHALVEMPVNYFKKLSEEIINKSEKIKEDNKHCSYYIEYINTYIYFLIELNMPLSFDETKKLFDFIIYFLKNKSKNKIIILPCLQALNNLTTKMALNKMNGILISEIPNILKFCKYENLISIQVINEIFELLITLLIKLGIKKIHQELEKVIFTNILDCLKDFYDCEINNDIKSILEKGFIILTKIIESNEKQAEIKNNYIFLLETKGIKEIIYNLVNSNIKIEIPIYLLNLLEINI